jgi:hypothetical protein
LIDAKANEKEEEQTVAGMKVRVLELDDMHLNLKSKMCLEFGS